MILQLPNTNASALSQAIVDARKRVGVSSGMVFTMIVVADSVRRFPSVLAACEAAGREHPSRILLIHNGAGKENRVDAEIRMGEEVPGEIIVLKFHGELVDHRESVLLPLLLPDSNVVVWWTGKAPENLAEDPVGRLGKRRITDSMSSSRPLAALELRARHIASGDTDLTWTRLTPWRALLAAAVDQYPAEITGAKVSGAKGNAAALLLQSWLECRLGIEVQRTVSRKGFGITGVTLRTAKGDISIVREDGKVATFSAPGLPRRKVALRRRDVNALITEELRRMDPDDILQATMARLAKHDRVAGVEELIEA